ncbi:MAG: hypothetical protein JSU72_20430, partial [Deltaproteobacteria bacterium]
GFTPQTGNDKMTSAYNYIVNLVVWQYLIALALDSVPLLARPPKNYVRKQRSRPIGGILWSVP